MVHRLVANAFLEKNINTNLTVNHKDGNRLNNNVKNLEWVTRAENIRYGYRNGQYTTCRKITLIKDNQNYNFYAMSQADLFLKRKTGYISNRLRRNQHIAISKDGNKYKIKGE